MTAHPVRAVVIDDSVTARCLLVEMLRAGGIEVVGEGSDGSSAAELVRTLRPSVVVMDIQMPGIDGFEATKQIMAETPTPIVIVTASYDAADVAISLQATRVGALTVLPKPEGPASPGFDEAAARLVTLVRAMADVKVVGRRGRRPAAEGGGAAGPRAEPIRVVGVGASTGGPAALYRFLAALPATLAVPVLVVQHIADGFVDGLVRWLGSATRLDVQVARHGAPLAAGEVYVAPTNAHLGALRSGHIALSDDPLIGGFRPSVSALFSSLAQSYGPGAVGVVLTGMGLDGLEGARDLRARGGLLFAQDETTSVVFGMPRAVADAGLANHVGPVELLAARIVELTGDRKGVR